MIKEYTIENFKAFAGPATVPIKPITLIFGPNSSGKSSIFQSLLMLKQTIEDGAGMESTLLTKGTLVDLGSYLEFVHNHDADRSFSFKVTVPAPRKIDDLFVLDDIILQYNPQVERLVQTVNFDTVGLEIAFLLREKAGVTVAQINLFLGDNSTPIISYSNKAPDRAFAERTEAARKWARDHWKGDEAAALKMQLTDSLELHHINSKHSYWKSYCSEFHSEDGSYTLDLWKALNDDCEGSFPEIILNFKNKPVDDTWALWKRLHQKGYDALAEVRSDSPSEVLNALLEVPVLYDFLMEVGEKFNPSSGLDRLVKVTGAYRRIPFSKLTSEHQVIIRQLNLMVIHQLQFLSSSTDRETEPFGVPQLLSEFEEEVIFLSHFLPDSGFAGKPREIIADCSDKSVAAYGSSISLFTFSAAETFKRFLQNIQFIGPLRPVPERFYVFSGTRTGFVGSTGKYVLDILVPDNDLLATVNRHFSHLGLGYELTVSEISSAGTGINGLLTLRLRKKSTGVITGLADVGFGVSQVLPIIVQSVLSKEKTILIEQPELHLHPAQQAELGDVFIESALGENKNTFLIETHSEHLILRLLRRIRETSEGCLEEGIHPLKPEDIAVIYAKPTPQGTKLIELHVSDDGDFVDKWPDGFFAERAKELF